MTLHFYSKLQVLYTSQSRLVLLSIQYMPQHGVWGLPLERSFFQLLISVFESTTNSSLDAAFLKLLTVIPILVFYWFGKSNISLMIYYQGKLIKMIFYTYSSFLSYKVTMQALSSIPVELSESLADPSIYSVNHQLLHGPKKWMPPSKNSLPYCNTTVLMAYLFYSDDITVFIDCYWQITAETMDVKGLQIKK